MSRGDIGFWLGIIALSGAVSALVSYSIAAVIALREEGHDDE